MNKKLLAAAVGATFAALPVLSAQAAKVKVYGKAEVEVVSVDYTDSKGVTSDKIAQGDSNGRSRWGIKASQDLGNGMKAFANLEWKLDPSNGAAEGNRVQVVGLKGGFGTLTLGRDHGAYKTTGGVKWDPYTATFMQARRNGGMSGGSFGTNGFRDDLIGYKTPKGLGGFSANIQYVVDETKGDDGDYHVGVKWKGGPVEVIGAVNNDDSKNAQNQKIGVRGKFGGFTGFVQYEDVENGGDIRANGNRLHVKTTKGTFALVGLGYKFGNTVVHGNIGSFDADAGGGTDVDYYAVGVTHFLSKKTRVYAGVTSVDPTGVAKADMIGGGIRFDF